MDIKDSRTCNFLSLQLLAEYYSADLKELEGYYYELVEDKVFLKTLNLKIDQCRDKYPKGLFLHKDIDNIFSHKMDAFHPHEIRRAYSKALASLPMEGERSPGKHDNGECVLCEVLRRILQQYNRTWRGFQLDAVHSCYCDDYCRESHIDEGHSHKDIGLQLSP